MGRGGDGKEKEENVDVDDNGRVQTCMKEESESWGIGSHVTGRMVGSLRVAVSVSAYRLEEIDLQ